MSKQYYAVRRDDNEQNSLKHWKYIKRERVNGKWRYIYDVKDKVGTEVKRAKTDIVTNKQNQEELDDRRNVKARDALRYTKDTISDLGDNIRENIALKKNQDDRQKQTNQDRLKRNIEIRSDYLKDKATTATSRITEDMTSDKKGSEKLLENVKKSISRSVEDYKKSKEKDKALAASDVKYMKQTISNCAKSIFEDAKNNAQQYVKSTKRKSTLRKDMTHQDVIYAETLITQLKNSITTDIKRNVEDAKKQQNRKKR